MDDGVRALEQATDRRLGDPDNPLLLSVRSAAAMSMPGAMSTFLNVGLNDDVVGRLSKRPDFAWTAWDCYRRLLQMWGMAHGVPRDDFDRIITDFKQRCAVREKVQFRPDQMCDIAHAYEGLLARAGIELDPDPRSQLLTAIRLVLDSWDAPVARAYRDQLSIADQWGTAAIVQQMVFGNLGPDSGTGVTFTSNPFANEPGVSLYGDFTTASQGEDVVAGLVHPWPVSRHQLERAAVAEEHCLETQFPEIYAELERLARDLVLQRGFDHQEVEFTFESGHREDLYLLQTRDHSWMKTASVPVFDAARPGAPGHRRRDRWRSHERVRGLRCRRSRTAGRRAPRSSPGARAPRHRPRRHRDDLRLRRVADRSWRGDLARRRHREQARQDRRGQLPIPGGG